MPRISYMSRPTLAQLFEKHPNLKKSCQEALGDEPPDTETVYSKWWRLGSELSDQPAYNEQIDLYFMKRIDGAAATQKERARIFFDDIEAIGVVSADLVIALRVEKLHSIADMMEEKLKE